ncbi:bifunctional protein-serine/threonine kinase/phosphatase [Pseudomonas sp. F(2018)]|uniref:bifunctional protein-serine/threonine kinase/phosphatase n=1 Tax=Pseudomonas sp. F(2018) TaxID=2502240 RepID=UPI0010F8BB11|nr:bifunctional protein-serine/threonine kinase/phosphatase [Pseudomonas sp. F(2018)]
MSSQLRISVGQHSDKGRKEVNQDFHGLCIPDEPQLSTKGIAIALADGIGSSAVSHIASEAAVSSFLEDYYCTSDAWSVKKSAWRVLMAANSWLHAQTRQSQYRYDMDRGYVCTLSALVLKATTAHLFHAGDTRIQRLRDGALERLTEDHRLWVSRDTSYLSRALGVGPHLELDYRQLALEPGDIFLLTSDGVHEYLEPAAMAALIRAYGDDLDGAARTLVQQAYSRGSDDNLTVQLVRIDQLPRQDAGELQQRVGDLALPPLLQARMEFDGYRIVREIHASSRSHVYLALDGKTPVALKAPATELQHDRAHLERLLTEEWIARRIDSAHVLKAPAQTRRRSYLYSVTEYIEGQTLRQWMVDNPRPGVEKVRDLVEQIARGLQAFHRLEMLHQDLRPDNLLIDATGTVRLIDFGSARVAGLSEQAPQRVQNPLPGTLQYMAPEYFIGEAGSPRSDLFSLAVIAYQLLSGRLPYGAEVAKCRNRAEQLRLVYHSVQDAERSIPPWIDEVLRKALHPDPNRRHAELSEFIHDLRQPSAEYLDRARPPLLERNPLLFWRGASLILAVLLAWQLLAH